MVTFDCGTEGSIDVLQFIANYMHDTYEEQKVDVQGFQK